MIAHGELAKYHVPTAPDRHERASSDAPPNIEVTVNRSTIDTPQRAPRRSAARELLKVVLGGIAGIFLGGLIVQFGLGIDLASTLGLVNPPQERIVRLRATSIWALASQACRHQPMRLIHRIPRPLPSQVFQVFARNSATQHGIGLMLTRAIPRCLGSDSIPIAPRRPDGMTCRAFGQLKMMGRYCCSSQAAARLERRASIRQ